MNRDGCVYSEEALGFERFFSNSEKSSVGLFVSLPACLSVRPSVQGTSVILFGFVELGGNPLEHHGYHCVAVAVAIVISEHGNNQHIWN